MVASVHAEAVTNNYQSVTQEDTIQDLNCIPKSLLLVEYLTPTQWQLISRRLEKEVVFRMVFQLLKLPVVIVSLPNNAGNPFGSDGAWNPKWAASWQNQQNDVRPAKTQISMGICPVWSESSLCAQWVAKDTSFLHADSEDSDQTGRMPRLIWVFAVAHHFVGFVMMRLILLVLPWGSSNAFVLNAVSKYRKNPKISDTQKICCNHPTFLTRWLCNWVMHPKDADRIRSSLNWVYTVCLDLSVQKLRIIAVISLNWW